MVLTLITLVGTLLTIQVLSASIGSTSAAATAGVVTPENCFQLFPF